jgi:hypothetical protein
MRQHDLFTFYLDPEVQDQFTLILETKKSLGAQTKMIFQHLPWPPGKSNHRKLRFYKIANTDITNTPLDMIPRAELSFIFIGQEGCSLYEFVHGSANRHFLLDDQLTLTDVVKRVAPELKLRRHHILLWTLGEDGRLVGVDIDKRVTVGSACPSRRFVISGTIVSAKPLVFRGGSCTNIKKSLFYNIEAGKSTVGQVISDVRYEFHNYAHSPERVAFFGMGRYLSDDYDLFEFPADDCIIVDLIPKPIFCEVAPSFVEISQARRQTIAAVDFDPMDRREISYIKTLIGRYLDVQCPLELKLGPQLLEDGKLLSDYRNPNGCKIVIAKQALPLQNTLPPEDPELLVAPSSKPSRRAGTPQANPVSPPSETVARSHRHGVSHSPPTGPSDLVVPSSAPQVPSPPDSSAQPAQRLKRRKRHKIPGRAQSDPVEPPVESGSPPPVSEEPPLQPVVSMSLSPTLVSARPLLPPGLGPRKGGKPLAEFPELLPPSPIEIPPTSSASTFECGLPRESAESPPPGPLPSVSEPTALGKRTVYTFSHRNHVDIFEPFEKFETIFDAKVRLGKRYGLALQDIVVLYQGKSLGDHLVLSRLRLKAGAKLSLFCKEQSDFILRTAVGMRLLPNLMQTFRLLNLRPQEGDDPEFDLDLAFAAQAIDAKTRLSGRFKLRMASQVALWNGLILVADEATLDEITFENGKVGFTLNSEIVGEYNELQKKQIAEETTPEDDIRMADLMAGLIDTLTNNEKEFLDGWTPEEQMGYHQKVLFLIQSSRDLEALAPVQ